MQPPWPTHPHPHRPTAPAHAATREVDKKHLPPADVMASVDAQELNRLFVNSARLDSDAIVQFVKTLSAISAEELRPVSHPRVFSLTKIVEIAHFNMGRIRWAVHGAGATVAPRASRAVRSAAAATLRVLPQPSAPPRTACPCDAPALATHHPCSLEAQPLTAAPLPATPPCRCRRAGWCGPASGQCWPTSSLRWGATRT